MDAAAGGSSSSSSSSIELADSATFRTKRPMFQSMQMHRTLNLTNSFYALATLVFSEPRLADALL